MSLIISADDFGLTPEVNKAIIQAFKLGIINRATAIANAPFFSEACELAHANGYENNIGVHFNITEGKAINPQISRTPLFCSNSGSFIYRRNKKMILTQFEMNAVSAECEDQILKFNEQRLHPTHLDSHHHIHTEWFIFKAIEPVIRKHGFSSVRMADNIVNSSVPKKIYKRLFNSYLKKRHWLSTSHFGDISDIIKCKASVFRNNSAIEVMVHPTIGAGNILIDALSGKEIESLIEILRNDKFMKTEGC
jgi:chitin disaccharide deacetylase